MFHLKSSFGLLLALACAGCAGGEGDGPKKYPVRGVVLVNGQPAERMAVTFHNADPQAPGNAARPVGVSDAEGRFALSTDADKDGAVEGDYEVTFFWPSDDGPMPGDRLGKRFGDRARSKHKLRIEPKENDLEPFRLEVDPKALKPSPPKPGRVAPQ